MSGVLRSTMTVLAAVAVSVPAPAAVAAERPRSERPRPEIDVRLRTTAGTQAGAAALASRADGLVRVAVSFTPGADAEPALAAARAAGGTVARRIPQLGVVTLEVPRVAVARVADALAGRAEVRAVSPVRSRQLAYAPNDPDYSAAQNYLSTVNAPAAWDVTKGSSNVLVAVVDSGVDVAHPDLAGKVAGAHNVVTGTTDVTDAIGHGTFVAGVAAAATDNEVGIAGAGFNTRLLAVKVDDGEGPIEADDLAAGIVWAADNGAHVIALSARGAAVDTTEQDAVAYAVGKGAVVVAAAGNDAQVTAAYPAAYPGVVAVGATNGTDRAAFSNYGTWVDVGAPGVAIRSTSPTAGTAAYTANYATGDGTSYAAALVAGQAALLRGVHASHTAADVTAAITESASGTFGFARGQVDFAASLDRLPPTTLPTLVTPADAATVSGAVTVTATSGAPRVRFTTPAGTSTVDVVDGVASTTFPTYGLAGAQPVTAHDCTAAKCATVGVTHTVTVANAAPVLTKPSPGATVNTAVFTAAATTADGGGAVRFLVDGTAVGFDATAPFEVLVDSSMLTEGAHSLTAVLCDTTSTRCDLAHQSPAVAFTVAALHPAMPSISPGTFSPNRDGKLDTTKVTYTLDVAQDVTLRVLDRFGNTVRGPFRFGTQAAGTRTWTWDGRRIGGTVAPNGTYRVRIDTSKTTPDGTLTGSASRTVKLDTLAPGLASVSGSGTTFYPYKDGYRDTFAPAVTLGEAGRLVLNVYSSAGTRVRTIDAGSKAAGRHTVAWNGRRADASALPAGTYRYEYVARDAAWNTRTTSRYTVYLSAKKLVAKTASKTVSPAGSMVGSYVGRCSVGETPARADWPGSIGYYSDYLNCATYQLDDLVYSEHRFTLPSAIKYGNVRVAGTGQEAFAGFGDVAHLSYIDTLDQVSDWGGLFGSRYGTYWGDSVPSSKLLVGRRLSWISGTVGDNWYHLRSFTVRWVYYVLA